jgi:hypothetical protein
MPKKVLGWTITVQIADDSEPLVYNVALPDERQAVAAVKRALAQPKDAVIKVRSELVECVYEALKLKPGDVLIGAQPAASKKPPRRPPSKHS